MPESEPLAESNCRMLLAAGVFGRVGLCTSDGPLVLPVNYGIVEEAVVFRTAPEGVLGTIEEGQQLAFEVDHVDYEYHQGWSVLAVGPAHVLTEEDELARVRRRWEPRPWASGERPRHVALRYVRLTGRRLGSGWTYANEVPVRRHLETPGT